MPAFLWCQFLRMMCLPKLRQDQSCLQDQSEREKEVALWFEGYVKYLAGGNADSPGFFFFGNCTK